MVTTGKLIDQYLYCVISKFLLIFLWVWEDSQSEAAADWEIKWMNLIKVFSDWKLNAK